jgi:sporulation protein YabP
MDFAKKHSIIIENRNRILLSGVNDVDSFNETDIVMYTVMGTLKVRGKKLQVVRFSTETGELEISGEIDAASYSKGTGKTPINFITRIFK